MTPRLVVNGVPLAFEACLAGLGIARLPGAFTADAVADGSLVEVLPRYALAATPMHVVFPSALHLPARVRAFVDMAVVHLQGVIASTARARKAR